MSSPFNDEMQQAIDEFNAWLCDEITSDDKCRAKGRKPPRPPFILVDDQYYYDFQRMISYPDKDNFEELIGSSFLSEEYKHLKYLEVWKKYEKNNSAIDRYIDTMHKKEYDYRMTNFTTAVKRMVNIIQNEQLETSEMDERYQDSFNYIIKMLRNYDPENYQIYNDKLKTITAINQKQEGLDAGEVAGSVPRTYSMGAQPLPSNQPLWEKEKLPIPPTEESAEDHINYGEGYDVSSPPQSCHSSLISLDEATEDDIQQMAMEYGPVTVAVRKSEQNAELEVIREETNSIKNVSESIKEKDPIKVNPEKEDFVSMEVDQGGEAGSVPRIYSMGAQPPSLNQPPQQKEKENYEKYEDEYFQHLSESSEDEENPTTLAVLLDYEQNRKIFEEQNRKIPEENSGKKPKQKDIKSEEGPKKMGEAGLVPRIHSMGAQPPPSNLPLDKEHINVEENKIINPEICQIDGPMDVTIDTDKDPSSSEDESSGKPTKNDKNPKKKTLKRNKDVHVCAPGGCMEWTPRRVNIFMHPGGIARGDVKDKFIT
ncbi:hypothetical protein JTB14_025507 [Gonioctena quinquepunctata]|nr:hypothetical protein JTB14_025507 [Gonioctena quinquepunctata]